uniref:Uncharacterized protein n=2 Tax=Oryza TaxID=4527 RepID=A0A0D3HDI7_9ORYZ
MEVTDNASPVARDPVRRRATCLRPLSLLPNGSLLIAYTCNDDMNDDVLGPVVFKSGRLT